MSRLTSLFAGSLLGSAPGPRDRATEGIARLRFALETMPGSRKYVFAPSTRAEILSELYDSFWGPYAHMFQPASTASLPMQTLLSEVQIRHAFCGAGGEEQSILGRSCGHIFVKGESCYRCKDCALDDSCVMCSRCFHATNHTGHNVTFYIAQQSGGCCDCGDPEAWRHPIGCRFHPPSPEASSTPTQSTPRASTRPLSVPFALQDHPNRASVPPELFESMSRTVAYALDFLLDTLDFSPDEPSAPRTEDELKMQPTCDPLTKDLYAVVLWNDEKHSFDEVITHICDLTGRTREEASVITNRIDEYGRGIIELGAYTPHLLELATTLSQMDLGVTVRRAYDTFREQTSSVIIEWLLDLTRSRIGLDTLILREVAAAQLLLPRRKDISSVLSSQDSTKVVSEMKDPARLDWMFLYHTRLWKKPRMSLKEIYVSVLTLSHDYKLAVAVHFANVYHRIIDSYLLVDREAETSIKYFALQLFTVPSVAEHIVRRHSIISRLLAIITAFFTNQIQNKRVLFPPDPTAEIDVDTFPFKSKRFMPVFSDLRYICHNVTVQRLIAHNHDFVLQFAKTCQLFMCINPNKRAASNHVEYETDAWISVFNVTLSLSRVIKVYGEAFAHATAEELVRAITTVMHEILMVCTLADARLDKTKFLPIEFHDVTFGEKAVQVVHFDVLEGWISFHHSLHWLLAELFKHVDLLDDDTLKEAGFDNIRQVILRNASDPAVLTLIDFPLRVLAMIAQIRTGLWVRNGFVIRGQLLHYRDFMLRELCYDQDLFILQSAFIMLDDPDLVLISILDRFQLLQWFNGDMNHAAYEGPHLSNMVEEVLYVFITILSENANANKMPLVAAVRREIVHALAVGPCPYTDLVKRVAERMVDDVCFDHVLREVTHFRAPDSTADVGIYELKDEAFDEVNPFFYHYTRNKREEVETILKARLKKKTGVADPVIVPISLCAREGPFRVVSLVFDSPVLLQVMFYGVDNILEYTNNMNASPPSAEAILDQTLHLIMLAIVERGAHYAQLAASRTFEKGRDLIDIMCSLEHHPKYTAYKSRAEWILAQLEMHVPHGVRSRRRVTSTSKGKGAKNLEDAKKRAAKARQDAIMKQMKAQQNSFAMNLDDLEDLDEDDIDEAPEERVTYGTCLVCQEDLDSSKGFGAMALIQPSRLVRRNPDGSNAYLNEALSAPTSLDRVTGLPVDNTFPPVDAEARDAARPTTSTPNDGFPAQHTRFGLHASICSHMMHLDCFQVYGVSIKQRHRAQGQRNHPESTSRKEYICPLCKSLGNFVLPVIPPSDTPLNTTPFSDWIRSAGITILKSKPDPQLDALQFKTGTGEFVFWAAQDSGYVTYARNQDTAEPADWHKMLDTLIVITKSFSQQTRHLRDRPEPEPSERGAGIYLPEDLVGYTIGCLEVALRGTGSPGSLVVDQVSETQMRMLRGLVSNLTNLAALHFKSRPDEGRGAIRQAIIKRLLPEWSRTSLTSLAFPLLLRDPLTILVETAAVAPDMLRHVLVLLYHVCLARTVIGLVYVLNKARATHTVPASRRSYSDIFGNIRMFCMSVVRHSPVFEHTADIVFEAFGEARVEKLLYTFSLPFLRRAAILCRAILPSAFPTTVFNDPDLSEYSRLLRFLGIPPLSELPNHDTLQTALSGWCAHYGHSHAASQLNCGVALDYPSTYRIARLPFVLDSLFAEEEKAMVCQRCKTVPVDAAICLICGTVCCMQSHCCKDSEPRDRGECNMHMRECGGAIGVYFLVKRCSLLYLYAGNGAFVQAPYLDAHGEIDILMRRGRRQYLHNARWDEVRKTWLNHGIPTLIARKLESTVDSGGWETL
ncbi:hypothetical protein BD410DRAFT_256866 [Rickenella mellea]|uniref:E3 ubiquitin-protein ligase n=1 Tax=Rickenella mellea TaxID=50990 RepID=A0A4Y7Q525_9AGAM|nr:hypothetical protein BD410DRAFT_256866 [Rickenella mellea]